MSPWQHHTHARASVGLPMACVQALTVSTTMPNPSKNNSRYYITFCYFLPNCHFTFKQDLSLVHIVTTLVYSSAVWPAIMAAFQISIQYSPNVWRSFYWLFVAVVVVENFMFTVIKPEEHCRLVFLQNGFFSWWIQLASWNPYRGLTKWFKFTKVNVSM